MLQVVINILNSLNNNFILYIMGTCTSKQNEDTCKLVSNKNIDKYLHKYKAKIKKNFLKFKKNDILYIYLCENDLRLQNSNFEYSILYNNIIEWANYGHFYWTFCILNNNFRKKYLLFHVDDSQNISINLNNITKKLKIELQK